MAETNHNNKKNYQIGFLGVYEFYQFIDGFLIVYPAADMYIR